MSKAPVSRDLSWSILCKYQSCHKKVDLFPMLLDVQFACVLAPLKFHFLFIHFIYSCHQQCTVYFVCTCLMLFIWVFPSWRVFSHSLSYFALHGIFPWSVQSYQRPKSVVVCVHCSRFDCECLSIVQLVSLCST